MIGEHILQSLTREMDDTERIYNYKLLLKFYEHPHITIIALTDG